jgi:sugar phosphate isomerase/epimerase
VTPQQLARLSINQITVKSWSLEQTLQGCAKAGIGGVGLWLEQIAETGTQRTAALLADYALDVTSVLRGGFFTGDTKADREAARRQNRHAVDLTAGIGSDLLYLVCGGVGSDRDLTGARHAVEDGLAELVPYAHSAGVRLAVEPLHPLFCGERSVIVTLAQALDLVAEFPEQDVGVAIDTFNLWWDPQLFEGLHRAGTRIISYQVCDWLVPAPHPVFSRGIPGDGVIDFAPITGAVLDAGYSGRIEVEIFNEQIWASDPAEVLERIKDRFAVVF